MKPVAPVTKTRMLTPFHNAGFTYRAALAPASKRQHAWLLDVIRVDRALELHERDAEVGEAVVGVDLAAGLVPARAAWAGNQNRRKTGAVAAVG